jgi:hypothetical protein
VKKKPKGPKGPNPLSVKKKAVKDGRREPKAKTKKEGEKGTEKEQADKGKGKEKAKESAAMDKVEVGKKRRREDMDLAGGDDDEGTRASKRRDLPGKSVSVEETVTLLHADGKSFGAGTGAGGVVIARRGRKRNRKRNKGKGGDGGEDGGGESASDG